MAIVVGTSSWADPGFVEHWYPKGLASKERLPFYAERFEAVELNSSFYAIPAVSTVESWAKTTPEDFRFDVKLHRLLSHHSAQLKELPADLRDQAETTDRGRVKLDPALLDEMVRRTAEAFEPLADSGKPGSYLLQLTRPSITGRARGDRRSRHGASRGRRAGPRDVFNNNARELAPKAARGLRQILGQDPGP